MNKKVYTYIIINIFILLMTLMLFICNYPFNADMLVSNKDIFLFVIAALVVHSIKALRLYVALYGSKICTIDYIKTYCKVTPVSIILPLKLGEIFRMYCYGYLINNYLKGVIVVLLDRFMDTAALITILTICMLFIGKASSFVVYLFLLFLIFLFIIYKIFPNFSYFWKKYYLSAKATKRKLWSLKQLERLNKVYNEITQVVKGRGVILYLLSLVAWSVELLNLMLITNLISKEFINKISEYLMSALISNKVIELNKFIIISIIILLVVYFAIKFIEIVKKKEVCNR